jgi:hypothetical protein
MNESGRALRALGAALLMAPLAVAQASVYTCVKNGKKVYSDRPCPESIHRRGSPARSPTEPLRRSKLEAEPDPAPTEGPFMAELRRSEKMMAEATFFGLACEEATAPENIREHCQYFLDRVKDDRALWQTMNRVTETAVEAVDGASWNRPEVNTRVNALSEECRRLSHFRTVATFKMQDVGSPRP